MADFCQQCSMDIFGEDMEDIIHPKEEFFDGRLERLNSFEYDNGIIMLKNSGEF